MTISFARAGRAGVSDCTLRTPELHPLREKTLAVVGLGCLGAASAIEFAKAGVRELRLLDGDFVDPATACRWPLGISAAGRCKVDALAEFIGKNFPRTHVVSLRHRIGGVRTPEEDGTSDLEIMGRLIDGAAAIFDSTAEIGVQHYCADTARAQGIPYFGVTGTHGGWGGMIVAIDPNRTQGCWMCYRLARDSGTIPEPPFDPKGEIQGRGCGDVSFTGAGFDMSMVALAGVRTAVAVLCRGHANAYPHIDWDVMSIALRTPDGALCAPAFTTSKVERHPDCRAHP